MAQKSGVHLFGESEPRGGSEVEAMFAIACGEFLDVSVVGPAEQAKLCLLYKRNGVTDEDVDVLASEPHALSGERGRKIAVGGL